MGVKMRILKGGFILNYTHLDLVEKDKEFKEVKLSSYEYIKYFQMDRSKKYNIYDRFVLSKLFLRRRVFCNKEGKCYIFEDVTKLGKVIEFIANIIISPTIEAFNEAKSVTNDFIKRWNRNNNYSFTKYSKDLIQDKNIGKE